MKPRVIAYDRHLKPLARELRGRMTRAEAILWRELKAKRMLGCDFDRQRPIDRYIVDFYCKALMLAIEVDGVTHDTLAALRKDSRRDARLAQLGITLLHYTDDEVVHNLDGVVLSIRRFIRTRAERWGGQAER